MNMFVISNDIQFTQGFVGSAQQLHILTLSGPTFSVVRQARGGLRGPDGKNQG